MPLAGFDELEQYADAAAARVPLAVAGGADRTVLEALRAAADRGWVAPVLAGHAGAIRSLAAEQGIALDGFELADADDAAATAVALVKNGNAQLLMKGQIATPDLMRAVLDPEKGLRSGRVICQVVLMEIVTHRRCFLLADTGVTIHPDLKKKLDIVRSVIGVAHALGEHCPRIALVAATEKVTETMPETFDAKEIERRAEAGELGECLVQGPLSFDLAYATDASDKKHIGGPVAGAADAMVFPNLVSANLTVKAIMYTADCRFGGVLHGTTRPVVFMSRADSTATRLRSLALALRLANTSVEHRDPH